MWKVQMCPCTCEMVHQIDACLSTNACLLLSCAATAFLPFLNLSVTPGVDTVYLGRFDDGASHAINIPRPGLPFGNSTQLNAFVSVH